MVLFDDDVDNIDNNDDDNVYDGQADLRENYCNDQDKDLLMPR